MNAFTYNADLFCEPCIAKIKEFLDGEGKKPANVDDETTFDSNDYPKGPVANGGGEADCPCYCGQCKIPLGNPLTTEGVEYVIDFLSHYVPHDWNGEVLDQWADDVVDYPLTEDQKKVVKTYREIRESEKQ